VSDGSHPLGTLLGSPASSLKLMIYHNNFATSKKRRRLNSVSALIPQKQSSQLLL
jgi:hypothetical protein